MKTQSNEQGSFSFKNHLKDNPAIIIIAIIFLIAYIPVFHWMWDRWFARDSYYSHGILVPFITGFLIWHRRDELKKIAIVPSKLGIQLIIFGVILQLFSALFRIYFSAGFSMLIVLGGVVLTFYGKEFFKKILFPLFFLFFMIPLPEVVIANLSFKMKIFAAHIATTILNDIRIPAIQEGSLIKMNHAYVVVDDVCSGLRSLISLTALGSIFAYWMKAPMYKRILLFLTTIPIAVITNVCRIVFLATVSNIWGPDYATGLIHDVSGFIVFGLAFILLFAAGRLIE